MLHELPIVFTSDGVPLAGTVRQKRPGLRFPGAD